MSMLLSLCFLLMSSFKGVQRQHSALSGRGDAKHIEGDLNGAARLEYLERALFERLVALGLLSRPASLRRFWQSW